MSLRKPGLCVLTTAITVVGGWWAAEFNDGAMDANWWTLVVVGLLPVVVFGLVVTEPKAERIAGLGLACATAVGWLLCYVERDDAMAGLSVMMGYGVAVAFVLYGVVASRSSVGHQP